MTSSAQDNETSSVDNGQPGDAASQKPSPGAQLAACRKERGWTVEQVASQLNLAPRQIVAIESDDHASLPGIAIVRGFIRAYAKLLKIDPAPLVAILGGEARMAADAFAPRKALSTPFAETRLPTMTSRPGLSSKWLYGALLLLLLGVAIWAAQRTGELGELSQSVNSEAKETQAPVSSSPSIEQSALPATPDAQQAETDSVTAPANGASTPVPAAPSVSVTSAIQGQSTNGSAVTSVVPPPEAKNELSLKVREDSWVELRRASNNITVIARVVKAGTTERFEIDEPMSLVVGNAAGVEASLRGAPLELKHNGNGNVARLNIKPE